MENDLTLIFLGAYAFFCIDVIVKMWHRVANYEDHTLWQRHLYASWGVIMGFVLIQLGLNAYVRIYSLWDSPIFESVQYIAFLTVQMCGMMMWTLTTHKYIMWKRIFHHMGPFVILLVLIFLIGDRFPILKYIYLIGQATYALPMFFLLLNNVKSYHLKLQQIYADVYGRTLNWLVHLTWAFGGIFISYVVLCWYYRDYYYFYYPIVILAWYFVDWHIIHIRETKELEESLSDEEIIQAAEKDMDVIRENPSSKSQSLREQTHHRIEASLEEVCLKGRLYLNPDLTVNDLAKSLNTNRTYISMYFSERRTNFLKYINDLRAEYAMYQLKNTNNTLLQVMNDSGFRHAETFRRAFQSRYNLDPKDVSRSE